MIERGSGVPVMAGDKGAKGRTEMPKAPREAIGRGHRLTGCQHEKKGSVGQGRRKGEGRRGGEAGGEEGEGQGDGRMGGTRMV